MLNNFFKPDSVAVIGASRESGKVGFELLKNLVENDFPGKIYPVNPKQVSILGLECYPKVGDIPGDVDMAIITTPAHTVPSLIDECGLKGIPFVIVITSNFSETGSEGERLERGNRF